MSTLVGQTVSHYTILEKLGAGGMGLVYKARDLKLDRTVALKFLPPDLTRDPDARRRFAHEAKAASALDHPNICTVYDIDETADGQLFICMACYQGETLKERIERGPLTVAQAVDIALQTAQGLAKAHQHGIVHRDIKPANIMITTDGIVKIVDFGLAKLSGRTQLTRSGSTLGTAAYMSPEQITGKDADHRTDLWSLGIVLYEMLTAKRPFDASYENAVLYSILNAELEWPAQSRTSIPASLIRVVSRCLSKAPEDRYQHAEEVLADLRRDHYGTVEGATPARKTWTHVLWIGGVIAFCVCAAVLYMVFAPTAIPPPEKSIAVLPFRSLSNEKVDEYFADGLTEDIIAELARVRGIGKVIARTSVMQFKGVDKSVRDIGRELDVATVLEGSYRRAGNRVRVVAQLIRTDTEDHLWAETYDRDLTEIFEIQGALAREIAAALQTTYTSAQGSRRGEKRTENPEAYRLYVIGRHHWNKRTDTDLRKALECFTEAIDVDPLYADAYAGLAMTYAVMSGYSDMPRSETGPRVQAAARKAIELNDALAHPYAALGFFAFFHANDFREGKRLLERALELSPNDVSVSHWYSHYLICVGRGGEAVTRIRREIEMDPLSRDFTVCLGDAYYYSRAYDEALATYREALAADSTRGDTSRMLVDHGHIARAFAARDMYDRAIESWQKAGRVGAQEWRTAYTRGGTRALWQAMLDGAFDASGHLRMSAEDVAGLYSRLGMNDRAFEWIEECRTTGHPLRYLKVSPDFDNLRSGPRFPRLLTSMGLNDHPQ